MKASRLIKLNTFNPSYDPYMQLTSLEAMVHTLRRQSYSYRTDIKLRKVIGSYSREHPMHGDSYADDCTNSTFFDAYLSSSLAACLAQYIEGLIRNETQLICYFLRGNCKNIAHKRYKKLELDKFWDVSIYYNESKSREEKNFVLGCYQLFDAIGYLHRLPDKFELNLQVLYRYRNNVMHNGVEWPIHLKKEFMILASKTKPDGFKWSMSDNEPWIAHITDAYIDELLVFCGELRDCFSSMS